MKLYHGSNKAIVKPIHKGSKKTNDFGYGFYCTSDIELAKEWSSRSEGSQAIVNVYEFDQSKLKILDLTKIDEKNWVSILFENRYTNLNIVQRKKANEFIKKYKKIDVSKYDVLIGYRADDAYFSSARYFLSDVIKLDEFIQIIKEGNLGKQIVLISEKSFKNIKLVDAISVNKIEYSEKEKLRREEANIHIRSIKEREV